MLGRLPGASLAGSVVPFAVALLLPLGWVVAHGWTLTGLYEESLGYRYFYSLRVVYGREYAFLPQGHLIDIGYQWLQRLLTVAGRPPGELFPRIDIFAYVAVATAHLVAVACFVWVVRSVSTASGRMFAALFWLAPYYAMGPSGVYVLLQPDYHSWILSIGLLTAGIFSRWADLMDRWSIRHSIGLGVFLGIAATIKATILVFPAAVVVGWILSRAWRRTLAMGALTGAVAGVFVLAILLATCRWRFDRLVRLFKDLCTFGGTTGPSDSYGSWLLSVVDRAPLLVTLAVVSPLLLALGLGLFRRRHERAVIVGLTMGAVLYHGILRWRFEPATWFEAVVFLQVGAWGMARTVAPHWLPVRAGGVGALATAVLLLLAGSHLTVAHFSEIERIHKAGRELWRAVSASDGRVAFLIPENSFRPLSVDSAIAKGMHNLFDNRPSPLVRRMFPEREYFLGVPRYSSTYYAGNPIDIRAFSRVVFVVVPAERNKAMQIETLEGYYHASLAPVDCSRDLDFGARVVVVCSSQDGIVGMRSTRATRLLD